MSRAAKRHRLEKARIKAAAKARSAELAEPVGTTPIFDLDRFNAIVAETLKEREKLLDETPEST